MKKLLLFLFGFLLLNLSAQVAINNSGATPDASAMLDISSTSSGLLIPRMTTTERDNISAPATGLTVYVTDDNSFYYYDGTSWVQLQQAGKSWLLNGNTGTSGVEFLGTTDAQPLIFKTNNTERVRIKDNGSIGVNATPVDNYLINAESNSHDVIGSFVSNRASSDDFGVVGMVANTDYYGIGGYFIGGWYGIYSRVYPTGSNYYTGLNVGVSGGTGTNYGIYDSVSGDGANYGAYQDISGNGTNYGNLLNVTGDGTSNYGLYSITSGNATNYSIYARTDTPNDSGAGAYILNNNATGIGLIAVGNGVSTYYTPNDGSGIAVTGSKFGIFGYTDLDDNTAVAVEGKYKGTTNTDATGVIGYSDPADNWGYGVKGYGGYMGVYGQAINGFTGVYGESNNSTFGVYASGDLGASGTKSFAIDYPLDPANKILKHFSIESNEVLNVYRGNVVLNQQGEAIVKMPVYFKAVNKNYSYQLTAIGSPATGIYVKKEIGNGDTFIIAGGNPGQKISWVVYAERNDPYLQQHPERRKVIIDKKDKEKGKYIMPELYGKSKDMGMFYSKTVSNDNKTQTKSVKLMNLKTKSKQEIEKEKKLEKFLKAKK